MTSMTKLVAALFLSALVCLSVASPAWAQNRWHSRTNDGSSSQRRHLCHANTGADPYLQPVRFVALRLP